MKRSMLVTVVAFVVLGVSEFALADLVSYPDFSDTTGLTLSGRAAVLTTGTDGRLHLQDGNWQRGAALLSNPIVLDQTFSTDFQFQIFNTVENYGEGSAADYLVFTIRTSAYGVTGNSVSVEFDLYNNGARDNYSGNHVGVNLNDSLVSIVTQHVSTDFNNEQIWHAWIDYDGSTIEVYASDNGIRPITPYISCGLDVGSILGTSDVYLGFRAASGAEGGDFDVLSWTFDTQPVPLPGGFLLGSIGLTFAGWRLRRWGRSPTSDNEIT